MKVKVKNHQIWGHLNADGGAAKGPLIEAIQELDKFNFADGKVRYSLIRNLQVLDAEFNLIDETRKKLVKESIEVQRKEDPSFKDGTLNGKWLMGFLEKLNDVMEEEAEVEIRQIPLSNLDLARNNIPLDTLKTLIDVIVADDLA